MERQRYSSRKNDSGAVEDRLEKRVMAEDLVAEGEGEDGGSGGRGRR